ncbi:conserved hypothetical protein [Prochlorococcus marinus str. MIT 9515]|uniref:Uncharacterized protein n=1 Tax=Prochlorococcus marinus (strain MIT 9515) TaxID=167542 RepID=A2BY25_PROM5|nr:hypothetical protein [Prochlorococcus marinus]ABM72686.1 conserved hypothetical protein [Prochlorococcus marinus str. MIT 9515]
MKIVSLFFQVVLSLIVIGFLIYFLTGYDSAFEADQLCHSSMSNFPSQSGNLGCDHDTETHQWILYETQDSSEPAKIMKRFRYKFL